MDLKKLLGNVAWITEEGYFDPAHRLFEDY